MPQFPADIRISLKEHRGPTHRIELIQQPVAERHWIGGDGTNLAEVTKATASQIAERIRRWLVSKS